MKKNETRANSEKAKIEKCKIKNPTTEISNISQEYSKFLTEILETFYENWVMYNVIMFIT